MDCSCSCSVFSTRSSTGVPEITRSPNLPVVPAALAPSGVAKSRSPLANSDNSAEAPPRPCIEALTTIVEHDRSAVCNQARSEPFQWAEDEGTIDLIAAPGPVQASRALRRHEVPIIPPGTSSMTMLLAFPRGTDQNSAPRSCGRVGPRSARTSSSIEASVIIDFGD